MKTPQHAIHAPFPAIPFEAKESLRNGHEGPLAGYLGALAEGLSLLAESIHQSEDDQRPIEEKQAPKSDAPKKASLPKEDEEDWDAYLDQFKKVVREGNEEERIAFLDQFNKVLREGNEDEWDATLDQFKKFLREENDEDWDGSLDQFEKVLSEGDDELIASYLRDASEIIFGLSRALRPVEGARSWKLEFKRAGRGRPVDRWAKARKDSRIRLALHFATVKFGKQEAAIAELEAKKGWSRATILRALNAGKKTKSHK